MRTILEFARYWRRPQLIPVEDRGPLRVCFVHTSMPVGGAEMLTANLVRRLDRERFLPELCCLKDFGPIGRELSREVPAVCRLLSSKYDVRVLPRLAQHLGRRRIDAVVTVGAGDKMFWGRLAARLARVPVVVSALHSTGWPDSVGILNRRLNKITDAFIGVAPQHGRHLVSDEGFPEEKVVVIPNGIDIDRFCPDPAGGARLRQLLNIPADAPVCGIVAALRPEKNHSLLLRAMAEVRQQMPKARLLIVGDGPERDRLQKVARKHNLTDAVHFLGTRQDIPQVLSGLDVFAISSEMEANPVSILEAMAVEKPVVATCVGSIPATVEHGVNGFLVDPGDASAFARHLLQLLSNPELGQAMGRVGRHKVCEHWTLDQMAYGYQELISQLYQRKCRQERKQGKEQVELPIG